MAMNHRNILVFISMMLCSFAYAQSSTEIAKNINKVKRDTMFIYAETTVKDKDEAYDGALAILEMKVSDWIRSKYAKEHIETSVAQVKKHLLHLETRRGEFYRAFVYVRKSDIMPVANKNDVTIFDVGRKSNKPTASIASEESPMENEHTTVGLSPDEEEMKQVDGFYDIEPYIKTLKSRQKLKNYGKYATMPVNEDCYLFVYNKQGSISAILRKNEKGQYNLYTLQEDDVKNYKDCGAIWVQLK